MFLETFFEGWSGRCFPSQIIALPICNTFEKKWFVGGIENDGNSCFIHVVLHELANFPEVYHDLLERPLSGREKELQKICLKILRNINGNVQTTLKELTYFRLILKENGWKDTYNSTFHKTIYKYFSPLLPPPSGSPLRLHQFLINQLGPVHYPIVFLNDSKFFFENMDQKLMEISFLDKKTPEMLIRILLAPEVMFQFSEVIETVSYRLSLQQIHYNPTNNHIATIKKIHDQWISINDDQREVCKEIPTKGIEWLFYRAVRK